MTKLEAILEKFERLRSRQKQVLREIQRAAKEESVSEEEAERVFAEVAEKYKGTLERLERYDRGEVNETETIIQKFQRLRALHKRVMEEIRKEALK